MPGCYGTISGIDRTNRLVGARLDEGLALWLPQGFPYRGDPPPPLSICWFSQVGPGKWVCEGLTGNARVVLHDDFLIVGASPNYGDTPWILGGFLGTIASATVEPDTQGAVNLTTTATINQYLRIAKNDLSCFPPTPPAALWWSAKMMVGTTGNNATTSMTIFAGLADINYWNATGAAGNSVMCRYDTPTDTNWFLHNATVAGGGINTISAVTPTAAAWIYLDLVWMAGLWAAAWFNGDGPYVSQTNIPSSTQPIEPGFLVFNRAAASRQAALDYQHLEWFAEAVDPLLLGNRVPGVPQPPG